MSTRYARLTPPNLSGLYTCSGSRLVRAHGLALTICPTVRLRRSHRDSDRYLTLARPGDRPPDILGSLYGDRAQSREDLHGAEFDDRPGGRRYGFSIAGPGVYDLARVRRQRKRAGR